MALFGIFGNKEKKNIQVNEANKANILALITNAQMSCKDSSAVSILRNIATQIQSQGESSSVELMTIDGEILKLLTDAKTYILKEQYPTAISKLNKALNYAIDRNQYCSMGGRKTKQDQKIENQAKKIMESVKAAPKTRAEELQEIIDNHNAELDGARKELEQLRELGAKNPNNLALRNRAQSVQNKILSISRQLNALSQELQRENAATTIIDNVGFNTTLERGRTYNENELEIARAELQAQDQARAEANAQIAQDNALLRAGAVGVLSGDPFADPLADGSLMADPFADPLMSQQSSGATSNFAGQSTQTTQTQYGAFNAGSIGTTEMANDIRKARQELERSIEIFNGKIEDANDDLQELNDELRPLLERRRTASPSDCLVLDGEIDRINARRNGVINKIKRYRQANAQLSDKLGLIDKLDTQQDLVATNAHIEQLTGGKFSDFQGLAMYLNDSIKQGNEQLEEIGLASSVAESEEIMMNSASAASAVLSDAGSLTKDEHKYDAIAHELGMTI